MLRLIPQVLDTTHIIAVAVALLAMFVAWRLLPASKLHRKKKFWATLPHVSDEGPRSARWLALQWLEKRDSVPHIFRSSCLRPLDPVDWIEHEPREVFEAQIKLKRRLIRAQATKERFYASMKAADVLAAEHEVLAMLLDHLEDHFTEDYRITRDSAGVPVAVVCLTVDEEFAVADYAECPLRLAGMLVQEDFILLSPESEQSEPSTFVAGCACFTFMEIGIRGEKGHMKIGEPISFIHTPVPGFNEPKGIGPKVAKFFKHLAPESPQYRSNWLLVAERGLDPMQYELTGDREDAIYLDINGKAPRDLHLRVELQSLRRLPKSRYILFTLHCYSDPLPSLQHLSKGAAVLRQTLLDLDETRRKYRGMNNDTVDTAAAYLAGLAGSYV